MSSNDPGIFLNDWYRCSTCKEIMTPNGMGAVFCQEHAPKKQTKEKPKKISPVYSFTHDGKTHILSDDRGYGYNNFSLKISFRGKFKVITGIKNIINHIKELTLNIEDRTIIEKILLEGSM